MKKYEKWKDRVKKAVLEMKETFTVTSLSNKLKLKKEKKIYRNRDRMVKYNGFMTKLCCVHFQLQKLVSEGLLRKVRNIYVVVKDATRTTMNALLSYALAPYRKMWRRVMRGLDKFKKPCDISNKNTNLEQVVFRSAAEMLTTSI